MGIDVAADFSSLLGEARLRRINGAVETLVGFWALRRSMEPAKEPRRLFRKSRGSVVDAIVQKSDPVFPVYYILPCMDKMSFLVPFGYRGPFFEEGEILWH